MYGDFLNTNPPAIDSLEIELKQIASTSQGLRTDTPVMNRYRLEPDAAVTVISQESENSAARRDHTKVSQVIEQPSSALVGPYEQRPSSGIDYRPSSTSSSSALPGTGSIGITPAHIPVAGGSLSRSQPATQSSKSLLLVASAHEARLTNKDNKFPKFFELCVNYGRWQRRLGEINISQYNSDGQLFDAVKRKYFELGKSRMKYFLEPVDVRYVRVRSRTWFPPALFFIF